VLYPTRWISPFAVLQKRMTMPAGRENYFAAECILDRSLASTARFGRREERREVFYLLLQFHFHHQRAMLTASRCSSRIQSLLFCDAAKSHTAATQRTKRLPAETGACGIASRRSAATLVSFHVHQGCRLSGSDQGAATR